MGRCILLLTLAFALVGLIRPGEASLMGLNKDPVKNWAVLVAGSDGWSNYRHQADVCHVYHLLRSHGIPASNIITMMKDDIAFNPNNPYRGKIFNDYAHRDVYAGVTIDYSGADVTPSMFRKVMLADPSLKSMGYKVLNSGPDDNVFLYYSDHGAKGLVAFPGSVLYAKDLIDILNKLNEGKRYNEMALYIEACYSGSMFEGLLPQGIRIFATTAANTGESSYAAFCGDPAIRTCLSDEYSYNWMVDSEKADLRIRSLGEQFVAVKQNTKQSHVMWYGDASMIRRPLANFQSGNNRTITNLKNEPNHMEPVDRVPAIHAHLFAMARTMNEANDGEAHEAAKRKMHRALQLASVVEHTFEDITRDVKHRIKPNVASVSLTEQLDCFKIVFDSFQIHCHTIQQVPEVAIHVPKLHDLCQAGYTPQDLVDSVMNVCA